MNPRKKLEQVNRMIADHIVSLLPDGVGFALFLFHFGDDEGFLSYVSNAQREDMIRVLEEQLERFKAGTDNTMGEA